MDPARLTLLLGWLGAGALTGTGPVWLVAGAVTAVAVSSVRRDAPVTDDDLHLRRHLAVCRRRDEPADALCVVGQAFEAPFLRTALRISDSSVLRRRDDTTVELLAVVDRRRLDRGALERRLAAGARTPLHTGWARFPEDAATLDALADTARARALGIAAPDHERAT